MNMPKPKVMSRLVAVGGGLGLLLVATPARANRMDYSGLDDLAVVVVLGSLLVLLGSLGSLITALVLGRKAAPRAPWKRTAAVVLLVVASLCTLWNVVAFGGSLYIGLVLTGASEKAAVLAILLVVGAIPLTASVLAILASARLLGRNKQPSPEQ